MQLTGLWLPEQSVKTQKRRKRRIKKGPKFYAIMKTMPWEERKRWIKLFLWRRGLRRYANNPPSFFNGILLELSPDFAALMQANAESLLRKLAELEVPPVHARINPWLLGHTIKMAKARYRVLNFVPQVPLLKPFEAFVWA